jgi:hypothetical protein
MIVDNKKQPLGRGNANEDTQLSVRGVLTKFQEGYTNRDLGRLDAFIEELFDSSNDTIIVGTCDSEWFKGKEEIRGLVGSDWKYWGNVVLDIDGAAISSQGDVAWVVTEGFLHSQLKEDRAYDKCLNNVKSSIDLNIGSKDKLLDILRIISTCVYDLNLGEEVVRPFRFTAVLIRFDDTWKFHSIHFSHPTVLPGDVRVVGDKRIG